MTKLKGIIAPFTTPFSQDGSIDLSLVKPQVDWLIENGVHGLAAGGSTGEGHVLNRDEYVALMEQTSKALDNRVPLVAGIIANSTSEVIARGNSVKPLNVAALQITPPSYLFRPDDDAMVKHFQEIHEECQIPILIYNVVPWCYLSPDLLLRIMDEVPGVLGVKQSAGDMKLFADLIRRAKPENMIFSAVDALLYSTPTFNKSDFLITSFSSVNTTPTSSSDSKEPLMSISFISFIIFSKVPMDNSFKLSISLAIVSICLTN